MQIRRLFTQAGHSPFHGIKFESRTSEIKNPDGSLVFHLDGVQVPDFWTQTSTDVLAQKYFRKAGVPSETRAVLEDSVPGWLQARTPVKGTPTGPETDLRQVIKRLAGCWTYWGWKHDYFTEESDARTFFDEMCFMLVNQMGSPNSPQWFNGGLSWAYGIEGPAQGHWYVDPKTAAALKSTSAYGRPQSHACYILGLSDDLVNPGGIMDLWTRESRIFKYGSGVGVNFSNLRGSGEPLSGGGESSGVMSFLKVGDVAAGAVKSGGTTRRAALMRILNIDHPDIEEFVEWKTKEQAKVAALVTGSRLLQKHITKILKIASRGNQKSSGTYDSANPEHNPELKAALQEAYEAGVLVSYLERAVQLAAQGYDDIWFEELDTEWRGDAYATVSGQNSNNTIRITNKFLDALEKDKDWDLIARRSGEVVKTLKAKELWGKVINAAWMTADPGLHFDDTIQEWHTLPNSGRINGSNPCVTGDTLVATSEGMVRIDTLQDREISVVGSDGKLHAIAPAFKTGTKPVYHLRTRAGYSLKLTADHRVHTLNRGDVPAAELTKDDRIALGRPVFGQETLPPDFAEYLGLMLGAGCTSADGGEAVLTLLLNEMAVAEVACRALNQFKGPFMAAGQGGHKTQVAGPPGTLQIAVRAVTILDEISRWALLDQKGPLRAFTPDAFRLDESSMAGVLRGLFTAAGPVANPKGKRQYVSLESPSLGLLGQTQVLLLSFGVKSKIYENRRPMGQTEVLFPDGKGGIKECPVEQIHSLRIARSSRTSFEGKIGFMLSSAKAGQTTTPARKVKAYSDPMSDTVVSLEFVGVEDVYDLTEPETHHFVANGLVVHNCSEYMHLDNTACNLASINLLKYLQPDGEFDLEAYEHSITLWATVLEITVLMSQFPSREVAVMSYRTRTTGLGYANLGALLMHLGLPYDSPEARALCGALTAILTGRAYATSALLAKDHGPFEEFHKNREPMLRVIRNHRRAAYSSSGSNYEGLSITPQPLDHSQCPRRIIEAARKAWDDALEWGMQFGYRNAQVSVIAPTGTIGLQMGCDTTGIEPDFSLVKFKKLAGGGFFRIINQSVPAALRRLGYTQTQIDSIQKYSAGTGTLSGAPHLNHVWLKKRGFQEVQIEALERDFPTAFSVGFSFNSFVLGEDFYRDVLGLVGPLSSLSGEALFAHWGFNPAQIREINDYVCGRKTLEGAPFLKDEHLAVFDCAGKCGEYGTRFISSSGHLGMLAAAQPFVSGSISKTVNVPSDAPISEIHNIYLNSHRIMLKCVALYRDGSKLSQPLNSTKSVLSFLKFEKEETTTTQILVAAEKLARGARRKLPGRRRGYTQKVRIGNQSVYLRTGEWEDGSLGEIFLDMHKEGAGFRSLMNSFAIAISIGLQYGVPLEEFVDAFIHTKFEPAGMVQGHDNIKMAGSVLDFIVRDLAFNYQGREDFVNVLQKDPPLSPPASLQEGQAVKPMPDRQLSILKGYSGNPCGTCGHLTLVPNGSCFKCETCGSTTGCS